MNILFINSIGKMKFGGGEKWMLTAAIGLKNKGHTVFVGGKKKSLFLKTVSENGIELFPVNIGADLGPLATWRIARFLKHHNIQVLICNLNKDVRVAGLAARLVHTPLVLARHGVLLCGNKWKHKITLTRLTDGIITNTRTIRDIYLGYGWFDESFIQVIYNGVDDLAGVLEYDFKARHPDKKIIFSAGRLAEQKGFGFLVEAARILAEQRDDLVFLVAGRGKLDKSLKRKVIKAGLADSFYFIGYIADIGSRLKGCDLFILPSLFEGMPNAIMEAMAAGKAVVATDVNGARELMVPGETGLIVPPRDPEALAEAITRLIDDPVSLEDMGEKGRQRVKEYFTVTGMIDILELYLREKLKAETAHA
jgi:glycosyltransferase involved in cell wall biosynthesis